MGILSNIVEACVCMPLQGTTKNEVLKELVYTLAKAGIVDNAEKVLEAVIIREQQGSTGLGQEIAIPHAKSDSVTDMAIVLGIAPNGIDFDSLDGKPTKVFFLIVANPHSSSAHIEALSEIARISRNENLIKELISSSNASQVLNLINNYE